MIINKAHRLTLTDDFDPNMGADYDFAQHIADTIQGLLTLRDNLSADFDMQVVINVSINPYAAYVDDTGDDAGDDETATEEDPNNLPF